MLIQLSNMVALHIIGLGLRKDREDQKFDEYFNKITTTDENGEEKTKIEIIYIMV